MELKTFNKKIISVFNAREIIKLSMDRFARMKYPKLVPIMEFESERYRVSDYGQVMLLHTSSKVGMELLTAVFMPYEGNSVPFLLLDVMQMKNKRTVFVEYYDCTVNGTEQPELTTIKEKYSSVKEYKEKPAWYVGERTPYSLIKSGEAKDDAVIEQMIMDSLKAYGTAVEKAERDPDNLKKLKVFRERMIKDGNPASDVLNKVLGIKGAADFFRKYVMPLSENE